MRKTVMVMLALTVGLSACGRIAESRFNPFNWFGRSEARRSSIAEAEAAKYVRQEDPRPLVDQVIQMSVEPIAEGAILRATGLPPTQGHWAAELVQVEGEGISEGVLVFDFRLIPPPYQAAQGTDFSRQVVVATYLSFNDLEGIGRIVVRGQRTERSVSR